MLTFRKPLGWIWGPRHVPYSRQAGKGPGACFMHSPGSINNYQADTLPPSCPLHTHLLSEVPSSPTVSPLILHLPPLCPAGRCAASVGLLTGLCACSQADPPGQWASSQGSQCLMPSVWAWARTPAQNPSNESERGAAPQEHCTSTTRQPALSFLDLSGNTVSCTHELALCQSSSHHLAFLTMAGPHLWQHQSWTIQICVKVKRQ